MGLTNQIAGFFDHYYLWKKSMGFCNFFHIVITQRRDRSKTNLLNYVWLGMPSYTQNFSFSFGASWSSEEWIEFEDSSKWMFRVFSQMNRRVIFLNWSERLFLSWSSFTKRSRLSSTDAHLLLLSLLEAIILLLMGYYKSRIV